MSSSTSPPSILSDGVAAVDADLTALLAEHTDPRHRAPLLHTLASGGKRIRPALTLTACEACGAPPVRARYAAATIELVHQYSVIVDDVIDASPMRRGRPTLWAAAGRSVAACVGGQHLAAALAAVARTPDPVEVAQCVATALKSLGDGELEDLLAEAAGREDEPWIVRERRPDPTEGDYRRLAGAKTASMFAAACELGAICARAPGPWRDALVAYGREIGLAYQVQDDVLDVFGDAARTGKPIGKDLADGKRGKLVLIFVREELGADAARELLAAPLPEAIARIEATAARDRAVGIGACAVASARAALAPLPPTTARDRLDAFASAAMGRAS